jgi:hypothetical protein
MHQQPNFNGASQPVHEVLFGERIGRARIFRIFGECPDTRSIKLNFCDPSFSDNEPCVRELFLFVLLNYASVWTIGEAKEDHRG